MITNNEISIFGTSFSDTLDSDAAESDAMNLKTDMDERKISTRNGVAQCHFADTQIAITHESNGVVVNQYGTTIDGKIHLGRTPSDIRINTFWVFNDELLTTLPSTNYTPIPVLQYKEPPYIKWAQAFMSFLSQLG